MFNAKGRLVAVATAGALILSGYVAAFAPATAANKKIIVWTDEQRGPVMRTLLVGKTPVKGYTIEIKSYANLDALNAAWNSATAATGPDLIISNAGLAASGGKSGKLAPLTLPSSVKSQFSKGAWSALSFKGKVYGVPLDVDTTAMFWNTKLFGKKSPKTFGAMVDYYNKNKTSKGLTAGFCAQEGTWGSHPVFTALGGGAWGYKKNGEPVPSKTSFNSAAFKANITKYLLGSDGKSNGFFKIGGDCINDWKAGKIPFLNTGGWQVDGINASGIKYKIGSVPGVKKGTFGSPWAGYQGAFVTSYAKNHGVAAAANQFAVNFMANATTQAQLSTFGNRPPANLLAAKKVKNPVLAGIALAGSRGVLQLSALLDAKPSGSNWYDLTGDVFNKILVEGQAVGATLDSAATKLLQNFQAGAANL